MVELNVLSTVVTLERDLEENDREFGICVADDSQVHRAG